MKSPEREGVNASLRGIRQMLRIIDGSVQTVINGMLDYTTLNQEHGVLNVPRNKVWVKVFAEESLKQDSMNGSQANIHDG